MWDTSSNSRMASWVIPQRPTKLFRTASRKYSWPRRCFTVAVISVGLVGGWRRTRRPSFGKTSSVLPSPTSKSFRRASSLAGTASLRFSWNSLQTTRSRLLAPSRPLIPRSFKADRARQNSRASLRGCSLLSLEFFAQCDNCGLTSVKLAKGEFVIEI